MRLSKVVSVLLATALGAGLFWMLSRFPDPSGANGYFYLKQTEVLANQHQFYFKDRSLAFLGLVTLYKLLGSSLFAFRAAISLTFVALLLGMQALMDSWSDAPEKTPILRLLGFLLISILVCTNDRCIELVLTFYKNFFALTLFVWALAWFSKNKVFSAALLIAALLSHKSIFLLALVFGASYGVGRFDRKKLFDRKKVIVAFGSVVALLALFLVFFERSQAYLLSLSGYFAKSAVGLQWLKTHLHDDRGFLTLYVSAAIFLLAWFWVRRTTPTQLRFFGDAVWLLILLTIHPFQMPGPGGPAYRILILLPVLLLPFIVTLAFQVRTRSAILLATAVFLVQVTQLNSVRTATFAHFIPNWSSFSGEVQNVKSYVTSSDHLTSHHGLEFYVDYITGIRSRSFISDDPKKESFRLAFVPDWLISESLARDEINQLKLMDLGKNYVLIHESDWMTIRERYLITSYWKNPEDRRPAFIYE